jgi:alpha-beta hydrolase superfamily lysophospholipase
MYCASERKKTMNIQRISKKAISPLGLKYNYSFVIPENPLALAIFVHGLSDHIGRFKELAERLADAGIACAMYDQRGCGLSDGTRGHVNRFYDLIYDLSASVHFFSTKLSKELPVFLIGHSMGSLVSLSYVLMYVTPISGLITIASAIEPTLKISHTKKRILLSIGRFLPSFMVDDTIRCEDTTRDKGQIEIHKRDPLRQEKTSLCTAIEAFGVIDFIKKMVRILDIPVFMIHGSDDRICHPHGTLKLAMWLRSEKHAYKIYPGMYHDMLHDVGREEVFKDIIEWLLCQISFFNADQYSIRRQLLRSPHWKDIGE